MAGPGRVPKDPDKLQRRNAPEHPTIELHRDASPTINAPKLPGATKFTAATRRWYREWCKSPQAAQFLNTDWLRLHMLAHIVDAYFRGDLKLFPEIRLNEQKLGATAEDRLRLRWRLAAMKDEEDRAGSASTSGRQRRRTDPRLKLVDGGKR